MSVLHERLDKLFLSTDLNIDPSAMEACLMAYLAMLRLEGKAVDLTNVTGASGPRLLGAVAKVV